MHIFLGTFVLWLIVKGKMQTYLAFAGLSGATTPAPPVKSSGGFWSGTPGADG